MLEKHIKKIENDIIIMRLQQWNYYYCVIQWIRTNRSSLYDVCISFGPEAMMVNENPTITVQMFVGLFCRSCKTGDPFKIEE